MFCFLLQTLCLAKEPSVRMTIHPEIFSPNNDGIKDFVTLKIETEKIKSIAFWEIQIQDLFGVLRRKISGTNELPSEQIWDGLDDYGTVCNEGAYTITLTITNKKNRTYNTSVQSTIDLTPPTVSLTSEQNEIVLMDHQIAPTTFYLSAVDLTSVLEWQIQIYDTQYNDFSSEASSSTIPKEWIWSEKLNSTPNEKLTIHLSVMDIAGNRGNSNDLSFRIKQTKTKPQETVQSLTPKQKRQDSKTKPETQNKNTVYLQLTSILSIEDLFEPNTYPPLLLNQASALLDPIALQLSQTPEARIMILGHVDKNKNTQSDRAISSAYAWKVFSYWVKQKGIDRTRISVKGLGSDVPIANNQYQLGRLRNRRIELQLFFPKQSH